MHSSGLLTVGIGALLGLLVGAGAVLAVLLIGVIGLTRSAKTGPNDTLELGSDGGDVFLQIEYGYDPANRLVTMINTLGSARATYTFEGLGLRRSAQNLGGPLTTFIWGGADYLMEKS